MGNFLSVISLNNIVIYLPQGLAVILLLGMAGWLLWKHTLPGPRALYSLLSLYIVLNLARGIFYSYVTYVGWQGNDLTKYWLPPHQPWYFYQHSLTEFFLPMGLNIALAVGWWLVLRFLYKKSNGDWIDKAEVALGLMTAALVGWPGIFVYLAVMFVLMMLWLVVLLITNRGAEVRVTITWPMLLAALVVLGGNTYVLAWLAQWGIKP